MFTPRRKENKNVSPALSVCIIRIDALIRLNAVLCLCCKPLSDAVVLVEYIVVCILYNCLRFFSFHFYGCN